MSDLKPCPFCGGEAVKVDGYTVACAHGLCIGWTIRRASPHEWNTRTVQAQIDAERERADKAEAALRVSVGGCDANDGWAHKPISIDGGKYFFCQDCGETLTKAVANRHSTAAAIRKGDQP